MVQEHIDNIYKFVDKYSDFGDCHMVDFFTHDHWGKFVAYNAQQTLLHTDENIYDVLSESALKNIEENLSSSNQGQITDLVCFLYEARNNSVFSLDVLTPLSRVQDAFSSTKNDEDNTHFSVQVKEFMNMKKSYEVDLMAPVVHQLALHCSTSNILDIGAGKGYLSTFLSLRYGLTVTGVDIAESNCIGALNRAKKYKKYMGKLKENRSNNDSVMKFDAINAKLINCIIVHRRPGPLC